MNSIYYSEAMNSYGTAYRGGRGFCRRTSQSGSMFSEQPVFTHRTSQPMRQSPNAAWKNGKKELPADGPRCSGLIDEAGEVLQTDEAQQTEREQAAL